MDYPQHEKETAQQPGEIEWSVEGMTCSNCAMTVTKLLERRGMQNVFVDFSSGDVKFSPANGFNREDIIKGIESLGYHIAKTDAGVQKHFFNFLSTVESKFYFCLAFTVPLLLHMILPFAWLHSAYVQLLLCLPVYVVGFFYFGKSAWGSVREGVPNMDVLIFIGAICQSC